MKKKNLNYLDRNFKKERTPDKLDLEARSLLMSKIKSKNTKFESDFIELLNQSLNIRFRTHAKDLKGTPDIVFDEQKVCVFLDSDFWHGWQFPRWQKTLKNEFWVNKIENNRKRDKITTNKLRYSGWKVIRIWEHNIKKDPEKCVCQINSQLF